MNVVGSTADLVFAGCRRTSVDLGEDPYQAALAAIEACEAEGRRPMRLDADDWLTLADIAARCGLSREIVRLWSIGQQGPGGFPPPLNPARDTRFCSWWETSAWIRRHTAYLPQSDGQEPALIAMNLALQLRNLMPRVSRQEVVLECITKSKGERNWESPRGSKKTAVCETASKVKEVLSNGSLDRRIG